MDDNIQRTEATAFKIPTETPESDGTAEWSSTTLVLVKLEAQGTMGLGYTYAHECCVSVLRTTLFPIVLGRDPLSVAWLWNEMNAAVRNFGRTGVVSSAIAALEMALWDLKARLLNIPLVKLLGIVRDQIPVYGSGGFTSYSEQQLCRQLEHLTSEGITMVKMKVGRSPELDPTRVAAARRAIGHSAQLFVDANGAYSAKQSLRLAAAFSEQNVRWFEEPVSSENLPGLRFVREHTEIRKGARRYLYSRAMCWVAVDRAIKLAQAHSYSAPLVRWASVQERIYNTIHHSFWNSKIRSLVQYQGANILDASLLLFPRVNCVNPADPRWQSTLQAIEKYLVEDCLVYRFKSALPSIKAGMVSKGTFSACSFWYVEALANANNLVKARTIFEKALGYANELGLYAEQLEPLREHLGNFPQALSHISLIRAACDLDEDLSRSM